MKKLILYFFLFIIGLILLYFVDAKAENIFGIIAPLFIVFVIIFIFYDNRVV